MAFVQAPPRVGAVAPGGRVARVGGAVSSLCAQVCEGAGEPKTHEMMRGGVRASPGGRCGEQLSCVGRAGAGRCMRGPLIELCAESGWAKCDRPVGQRAGVCASGVVVDLLLIVALLYLRCLSIISGRVQSYRVGDFYT